MLRENVYADKITYLFHYYILIPAFDKYFYEKNCGNDTIDPYPPFEGKLVRLLCISKERFERLTLETREFRIKKAASKNTPVRVQRIKQLCKAAEPYSPKIQKAVHLEYAPTKIWQTRHSEFWQWQRVSEWHREYGQDEIINKKRHILL